MFSANVLVVEDAQTTGKQIADMLANMGHGVRLYKSAEEGLDAFAKRSFDVVLSDVYLPGLDGIEMVQRMHAVDPTLALIIMTSYHDQEIAVRAMACGIRSFLKKPFGKDELREKIEDALEERQRTVEQRHLLGDLFRERSELQEKVVAQNRQLTRTEEYLDNLLDAAPFGILSTGREGFVKTLNRTAQRMYQYAEEEVVGKSASLLFGDEQNFPQEERGFHMRKDGTTFPVLVRHREVLDDQERYIAQLFVVEDLSESESLQDQLLYAERLSVLGQMAPRIAHEFKTPLQLIIGFAELTLEHLKNGNAEAGIETVGFLLPATQELIELVQQISNLGKPKESQVARIDLAEELEKILQPMQRLGLLKYCRMEKEFAPSLPRIQGDSNQIEQVFRNLIVNAVHAMEGTAERVLKLGLKASPDGRYVQCEVGDTGQGIPADNLDKIFQPFFTTKIQGKGTGLGLPIVKSVLNRHGATLRVESDVGKGTCFHISFPAVQA